MEGLHRPGTSWAVFTPSPVTSLLCGSPLLYAWLSWRAKQGGRKQGEESPTRARHCGLQWNHSHLYTHRAESGLRRTTYPNQPTTSCILHVSAGLRAGAVLPGFDPVTDGFSLYLYSDIVWCRATRGLVQNVLSDSVFRLTFPTSVSRPTLQSNRNTHRLFANITADLREIC